MRSVVSIGVERHATFQIALQQACSHVECVIIRQVAEASQLRSEFVTGEDNLRRLKAATQ
jgi:hypothetical protein